MVAASLYQASQSRPLGPWDIARPTACLECGMTRAFFEPTFHSTAWLQVPAFAQ